MAKVYERIDQRLTDFLTAQPIFFVATAPLSADGHVNLSPKGLNRVAVIDPSTVAYLDLTGSGIETIAHLRENGRIVLMFCAFEGPPRIVRLHGRGRFVLRDDEAFDGLAAHFPASDGARAVVVVDVQRVSDSCGHGVPRMRYEEERPQMDAWIEHKGVAGLTDYRAEKNATSLDGLPGLSG